MMEQFEEDEIHDPANYSGVPEHILRDILDIDINLENGEGVEGGGNSNNFVCIVKFSVHAEHYEKFRHYQSYFFKELVPRDEGFVAAYCMTPYSGQNTLVSGSGSGNETARDFKEVYICLKWANRTSFEQHLQQQYAFDLMQYYYSENHLGSTPQVTIWENVTGAHDEILFGTTIGERLLQLSSRQEVSSTSEGTVSFETHIPKIFVMVRKRCFSMRDELRVRILFQIAVRLARKTKEAEKTCCLGYDVLRSRPIEGSASLPDILEVAYWRSKDDFVDHLKSSYVDNAIQAFSLFSDDKNQLTTTTTFWELQADGLLESHPNIDFMKHHIRILSNSSR